MWPRVVAPVLFLVLATVATIAIPAGDSPARAGTPRNDAGGDPLPAGALTRLGTVRWRHGGVVSFAAFLANGKSVVTVTDDHTIKVWEYPSGKELRRIPLPPDDNPLLPGVADLLLLDADDLPTPVLGRDGKTFVLCTPGRGIRVYELPAGKLLASHRALNESVLAIALSPDGKQVAILDEDEGLRVWDWARATPVRRLTAGLPQDERCEETELLYTADGTAIVTVSMKKAKKAWKYSLRFVETASGKEQRRIATGEEAAVCPVISPDNKLLAYGEDEGVAVVDLSTGKRLRLLKSDQSAVALTFGKDSTTLLMLSGSGVVRRWNARTGKVVPPPGGPKAAALSFGEASRHLGNTARWALSPDERLLVRASVGPAPDFLDLTSGKSAAIGGGPIASACWVQFTPDGKQLLARADSAPVHRWDAATGNDLGPLPGDTRFDKSAVSPDGRVVVRLEKPMVLFVDATTGELQARVKMAAPDREASVAFDAAGKVVAVRYPGQATVEFMEIAAGKSLRQLPVAKPGSAGQKDTSVHVPRGILLSGDGKLMALAVEGPAVEVWDVPGGRRLVTLDCAVREPGGAFSPDGRCLLLEAGMDTVEVFEIATGKMRDRLGQPSLAGQALGRPWRPALQSGPIIAFAPDGRTVAYAGLDGAVRLWAYPGGKELAAFRGHAGPVTAVAFSPAGDRLASASADTTVLVWDLAHLSAGK